VKAEWTKPGKAKTQKESYSREKCSNRKSKKELENESPPIFTRESNQFQMKSMNCSISEY
jgi:hypothetical protein